MLSRLWRATSAPRSAVFAGALSGALFGGVGGRVVMRIVFLIDGSTEGARTDFGHVGEVTFGGTFTLLMLTTVAGAICGFFYLGLRRWLPGTGPLRGAAFGLLMMFGPALIIFNKDATDLHIFEPILPMFGMFVVLVVLYGIGTALVADRLHPGPSASSGKRVDVVVRAAWCVAAAWIVFQAAILTADLRDLEGTCLSADGQGGCAAFERR
jgi:hypothetical protein